MADNALPPELFRLVSAAERTARDAAWEAFVSANSKLLLHVARSLGGDHDAAMDRYACVLEQLRQDDYRRLRAYVADGRSKFSTWLTVVGRRLCLDYHRQRYGRVRGAPDPSGRIVVERAARRRLADLVTERMDIWDASDLSGRAPGDPESDLRSAELHLALERSLESLETADQLLLRLRFDDDLSAREIVTVMGFANPFVVYRRLSVILDSLRRSLAQQGVESPVP
jgi:RNA polymerase sigma factor (sigma-70 family)